MVLHYQSDSLFAQINLSSKVNNFCIVIYLSVVFLIFRPVVITPKRKYCWFQKGCFSGDYLKDVSDSIFTTFFHLVTMTMVATKFEKKVPNKQLSRSTQNLSCQWCIPGGNSRLVRPTLTHSYCSFVFNYQALKYCVAISSPSLFIIFSDR